MGEWVSGLVCVCVCVCVRACVRACVRVCMLVLSMMRFTTLLCCRNVLPVLCAVTVLLLAFQFVSKEMFPF